MTQQEEPEKTLLEIRRAIAQKIANALEDHSAISAILVIGSVALGYVDERSDIDLMVVCRTPLLTVEERVKRLSNLGQNWQWNVPTGNALFGEVEDRDGVVDGIAVSVCYQTIANLLTVVDEVLTKGAITTQLIPFRPYTLPALLQRALLLFDKEKIITELLRQTQTYPPRLKHNIFRHFIPHLQEATDELVATAERQLGALGFLFHLNHAADALVSILYALNDVYDPAERRSQLVILPTLSRIPYNFIQRFTEILEGPFHPEGALQRAHRFRQLTNEVLQMVNFAMS